MTVNKLNISAAADALVKLATQAHAADSTPPVMVAGIGGGFARDEKGAAPASTRFSGALRSPVVSAADMPIGGHGGTDMSAGLDAALAAIDASGAQRSRNVIIVTDGPVAPEHAATLRRELVRALGSEAKADAALEGVRNMGASFLAFGAAVEDRDVAKRHSEG